MLLVRLAKLGIEKRDPDTLTDEEKESFARLGKYRTVPVASYFRLWFRNNRFCAYAKLWFAIVVTCKNLGRYPEMEVLDISLTKDSILFPHAAHSPFYWRILKKTILFSSFKNPYKNRQTRKL